MSQANIVKKVKIDGDWKRRRESAGVTAAQALEAQRRKRHELEGRKLGVPGFELAGEAP